MIDGIIKSGQPKCANIKCTKVIGEENCYYCPNTATDMHPQGFFYCTTCAIAEQTSGTAQI